MTSEGGVRICSTASTSLMAFRSSSALTLSRLDQTVPPLIRHRATDERSHERPMHSEMAAGAKQIPVAPPGIGRMSFEDVASPRVPFESRATMQTDGRAIRNRRGPDSCRLFRRDEEAFLAIGPSLQFVECGAVARHPILHCRNRPRPIFQARNCTVHKILRLNRWIALEDLLLAHEQRHLAVMREGVFLVRQPNLQKVSTSNGSPTGVDQDRIHSQSEERRGAEETRRESTSAAGESAEFRPVGLFRFCRHRLGVNEPGK